MCVKYTNIAKFRISDRISFSYKWNYSSNFNLTQLNPSFSAKKKILRNSDLGVAKMINASGNFTGNLLYISFFCSRSSQYNTRSFFLLLNGNTAKCAERYFTFSQNNIRIRREKT